MKTIVLYVFWIGLTLCGCGVESIFGTVKEKATYIAIFVITMIAAFVLRER